MQLDTAHFRFDLLSLVPSYFPRTSFSEDDGRCLSAVLENGYAVAEFRDGDTVFRESVAVSGSFEAERTAVKRAVCAVLGHASGKTSPWGIVSGVHPVSFYRRVRESAGEDANRIFLDEFGVSAEKLQLCETVYTVQQRATLLCLPDTHSLYISIPFCPTRCAYCSFVSEVTNREHGLIDRYVECLCREIRARAAEINGKRLLSIYMGGGTPTTLSAEQLRMLLGTVAECLDLSHVTEYTVEAGRPDTVTDEKLAVLAEYGVNRISINPQTLHDRTLQRIGRSHTVEQFFRAYEMASRYPFDINVDLIAGLYGESYGDFAESLGRILDLNPANVTVHGLCLKRGSDYANRDLPPEEEAGQMYALSASATAARGYEPYYLYRQKNTVGNGENVGYARDGKICLYNIWMMGDMQSVVGVGANAVTKHPTGGRMERICNTKYAYNYIKEV